MILTVPYELGQLVYVIEEYSDVITKDCTTCAGSGKLFRKDGSHAARCQDCKGQGNLRAHSESKWRADCRKVMKVSASKHQHYRTGEYLDKAQINTVRPGDEGSYAAYATAYNIPNGLVFATEEEALAECEILNASNEQDQTQFASDHAS